MATISEGSKVFIRSGNERAAQAVVLSRKADTMRIAVRRSDDVLVLTRLNGSWITEDLEPVEISFVGERHVPKAPVSESDCICSKALAAHLIHLLLNGDEENVLGIGRSPQQDTGSAAAPCHLNVLPITGQTTIRTDVPLVSYPRLAV